MIAIVLLLTAIAVEVGSTASLPRTDSFHDPVWTTGVLAGYALSIWLLSVVVRTLPVSMAYAVWSGLGTAAVAVIGYLVLDEAMSPLKLVALGLIVVGVVALNLA